jgi:hypothetical protein
MTQTSPCSVDKLNLLRGLVDREHHLLHDRTNIFLIWQSILIAGFGLGKDSSQLIIILPLLGFASSLIWLYVGHRSVKLENYYFRQVLICESCFPESERVYTDAKNWRKITDAPIMGLRVAMYLAYVLPGLWAITWFVLLLWRPSPISG